MGTTTQRELGRLYGTFDSNGNLIELHDERGTKLGATLGFDSQGNPTANIIPRNNTLANLLTLNGGVNELAVVTDIPALAKFNGVVGGMATLPMYEDYKGIASTTATPFTVTAKLMSVGWSIDPANPLTVQNTAPLNSGESWIFDSFGDLYKFTNVGGSIFYITETRDPAFLFTATILAKKANALGYSAQAAHVGATCLGLNAVSKISREVQLGTGDITTGFHGFVTLTGFVTANTTKELTTDAAVANVTAGLENVLATNSASQVIEIVQMTVIAKVGTVFNVFRRKGGLYQANVGNTLLTQLQAMAVDGTDLNPTAGVTTSVAIVGNRLQVNVTTPAGVGASSMAYIQYRIIN